MLRFVAMTFVMYHCVISGSCLRNRGYVSNRDVLSEVLLFCVVLSVFLCFMLCVVLVYVCVCMFLCSLYAPIHQSKFQVGVNLLGNKYYSDSDSDSEMYGLLT